MASSIAFLVYRLLKTPGFGRGRVHSILSKFGSLLSQKDVTRVESKIFRETNDMLERDKEEWNRLKSMGVQIFSYWDDEYPGRIRRLCGDRSPPLLFALGNFSIIDGPSVGFCGSRRGGEKGLEIARDCVDQLVRAEINIISGYARGVDTVTHRTALENDGTTAIILPEGIFNFRIKRELKKMWDWKRVVVISEFLPTHRWRVGNAMQRNATICTLSDAMILIEARATGGSIAAGKTCLSLGIPLFASVYGDTTEESEGNRDLLQGGARPLMKSRSSGRANIKPVYDVVL